MKLVFEIEFSNRMHTLGNIKHHLEACINAIDASVGDVDFNELEKVSKVFPVRLPNDAVILGESTHMDDVPLARICLSEEPFDSCLYTAKHAKENGQPDCLHHYTNVRGSTKVIRTNEDEEEKTS